MPLGKNNTMNQTNLLKNTFSGKTIFITGHTGFQGSWLTLWLEMLGAKIIGFSKPPLTNPSLFNILNLEKSIKHIVGDVNDYRHISKSIQKANPDFVIHLAAQALVRKSYEVPLDTFTTNIIGTANVLHSLRALKNNVSCVIMTSDKCYENLDGAKPHKESDPMGGDDPYSASKGAAELVTSSFKKSFFNNQHDHRISSVRAGNVIGGGDWSDDRLIPDLVDSIINNKKIVIRNPDHVRPWQFVLESLSGLLWILHKMSTNNKKYNQSWNLGPDKKNIITVEQIVKKFSKEWKSINLKNNTQQKSKFSESNSLRLDSTKAKKLLNWKNVYDIDQTIFETINWYRYFHEKPSMIKELSIQQIEAYVVNANKKKFLWAQ